MSGRLRLRLALLLGCVLIACMYGTAAADTWEGTHRFRVAIQGSVSTTAEPDGLSSTMPLEFRTTLHVAFDPPLTAGVRRAQVVFHDTTFRQGETAVDLSLRPSGYTVLFDANYRPADIEDVQELTIRGISLDQLLNLLYPSLPGSEPAPSQTWTYQHTQILSTPDGEVTIPTTTTYTVRELRANGVAVVHSSVRGNNEISAHPGTLTVRQLGSGVAHIDTQTSQLVTSATTTDTLIERAGDSRSSSGTIRTRILMTTSIDRLADLPPAPQTLGPRYSDPAERFTLTLPNGWDDIPELLRGTTTLFVAPDGPAHLFVDVTPSVPESETAQSVAALLDRLERRLDAFSVITRATPSTLGGEPALFVEYRYTDGQPFMEGALFARYGGYDYIFQYADTVNDYARSGRNTLFLLARQFEFGPNPDGRVSPERLMAAPTTLYESSEAGFAVEVPDLWAHTAHDDVSVIFTEIGGAGRLSIHVETLPEDATVTGLLNTWIRQMRSTQPDFELLDPVETASLGPLTGAGLSYRSPSLSDRTNRVVVAPFGSTLFVVSIEYRSSGFDERLEVFERILASFRPLIDTAVMPAAVQDAQSAPAPPESASHGILIGRILHRYVQGDEFATRSADRVRVEVSAGDFRAYARTDDAGYFYIANIPAIGEKAVAIESVRGRLFGFVDEVDIALTNLALTAPGRVALLGELTLTLDESHSLRVDIDAAADAEGQSSVHLYFSEQFGADPWADIIDADHTRRRGSQ